jgi:preprotein translocase subunit SecF
MDTQRYTRKVKTCEKDLAKAKENLEKWGAAVSTHAAPQNGGTGSSSLTAPKEEPSSVIETPVNQANSSITADASTKVNGDLGTKQEKSELQLVFFDALIIALYLTIRHISCLYLRFARQDR